MKTLVGHIGNKGAYQLVLNGLAQLENLGKSKVGMALVDENHVLSLSVAETTQELKKEALYYGEHSQIAIGAVGVTTGVQAMPPHYNPSGSLAGVFTGEIQNFLEISQQLTEAGYVLETQTHSEMVVQLIDHYYQNGLIALEHAVSKAKAQLKGNYALLMVSKMDPDKLVVSKNNLPMAIGKKGNAYLISNDLRVIRNYSRNVLFVDNEEVVVMDLNGGLQSQLVGETMFSPIPFGTAQESQSVYTNKLGVVVCQSLGQLFAVRNYLQTAAKRVQQVPQNLTQTKTETCGMLVVLKQDLNGLRPLFRNVVSIGNANGMQVFKTQASEKIMELLNQKLVGIAESNYDLTQTLIEIPLQMLAFTPALEMQSKVAA